MQREDFEPASSRDFIKTNSQVKLIKRPKFNKNTNYYDYLRIANQEETEPETRASNIPIIKSRINIYLDQTDEKEIQIVALQMKFWAPNTNEKDVLDNFDLNNKQFRILQPAWYFFKDNYHINLLFEQIMQRISFGEQSNKHLNYLLKKILNKHPNKLIQTHQLQLTQLSPVIDTQSKTVSVENYKKETLKNIPYEKIPNIHQQNLNQMQTLTKNIQTTLSESNVESQKPTTTYPFLKTTEMCPIGKTSLQDPMCVLGPRFLDEVDLENLNPSIIHEHGSWIQTSITSKIRTLIFLLKKTIFYDVNGRPKSHLLYDEITNQHTTLNLLPESSNLISLYANSHNDTIYIFVRSEYNTKMVRALFDVYDFIMEKIKRNTMLLFIRIIGYKEGCLGCIHFYRRLLNPNYSNIFRGYLFNMPINTKKIDQNVIVETLANASFCKFFPAYHLAYDSLKQYQVVNVIMLDSTDNSINLYMKDNANQLILQSKYDPVLVSRKTYKNEMHMQTISGTSYNFCGPGTNLKERLSKGDVPIDEIDEACRQHDIAYLRGDNAREADKKLIDAVSKAKNAPFLNKLQIIAMMYKKMFLENTGILSKTFFQ